MIFDHRHVILGLPIKIGTQISIRGPGPAPLLSVSIRCIYTHSYSGKVSRIMWSAVKLSKYHITYTLSLRDVNVQFDLYGKQMAYF